MPDSTATRLLEILLPDGGYAVNLVEAYFDESGTHDGSKFLVVAGYIFEKGKCAQLDLKWKSMLDRYGLTHFHMADCGADPGHGEFAKLTKPERIAAATEAIELTRTHAELGFAVSIDMRYAGLIPDLGLFKSPYTFICWHGLMAVRKWADTTNFHGECAYFFEDGHGSKPEALRVMSDVVSHPEKKAVYRYSSLSFADKVRVRPLQCADLLAWHWYNYCIRKQKGIEELRKDFANLMQLTHLVNHFDESYLRRLTANVALTKFSDQWGFWRGPV